MVGLVEIISNCSLLIQNIFSLSLVCNNDIHSAETKEKGLWGKCEKHYTWTAIMTSKAPDISKNWFVDVLLLLPVHAEQSKEPEL